MELARAQDDVRTALRRELEPTITVLRETLETLADDPFGRLSEERRSALQEHADQVIRPLSRQMNRSVDPYPPTPTAETREARTETGGLRPPRLLSTEPTALIGPTLLVSIALASIAFLRFPPEASGIAIMSLATAVLVVFGWSAGRLWRAVALGTIGGIGSWLALLVLLTCVGGLATGAMLLGQRVWGPTFTPTYAFLLLTPVAGMVTSVYRATYAAKLADEDRLREFTQSLDELESEVRRSLWFERKRLAALLHNDVQARLRAVSSSLRQDLSDGNEGSLADELETCLVVLEGVALPPTVMLDDPQQSLDQVFALWSNSVTFIPDVDADLWRELDAGTGNAAVDIVREAVLNSVRHGGATRIAVSVGRTSRSVVVRVEDNGLGPSNTAAPGLGSQFLDDMCSTWHLSPRSTGGAVLQAELPIHLGSVARM